MKKLFLIFILSVVCSCGGAKYSYTFDTGKQLDFSEGKWILNSTKSNSTVFDTELYQASLKGFKKILGDSLLEMDDLRSSKLVAPKISFNLSNSDLKQLRNDTDCDFIINVGGNVISDGAGTLSFPDQDNFSSNRAAVSIAIYDLNVGTLISSSQVYGKTSTQAASFNEDDKLPTINPSSHMIMLAGGKKLIRKYEKNRLDK
ncbi:hypothetical protein [Pricia sp.]|uniref:hypothetical protein n=1 Tax=Pricia sp. TaxID=2268138 RepID=UPI0035938BFB